MRRSALASPPPRWRRRVRRIIVSLVLLAGAGAGIVVFRDHTRTESAPTTSAVVLKTASVETGDLTTTEKIDGTISETDTITVLHRIEGQTSSATSSSANGSAANGSSSGGAPAASGSSAAPIAALTNDASSFLPSADCPAPGSSAAPTNVPVDPSAVPPSDATTTSTTAVSTTTSTTVPDVAASTTSPAAPVPGACDSTTPTTATTAVADTTPTTVAGGGAPVGGLGGAFPSGAAGGGSSSGAASGPSSGSSSSTRITQLVTWVAAPGTAIASGDSIYSIEGAPVTAMYGSLPAWRSLSTSSADGADVLQLESNLRALGFDPDAAMTIDDEFDSDTKAAVERWQAALGVEVTGEVALGTVVFLPTATTVTSTSVAIGDEVGDGSSIVSLEGTTQQVVIDVPTEDQPYVLPGTAVVVAGTPATVESLRSADESGTIAVQAIISPSAHVDAADGSAVKVQLTIEQATGVLLVPADALLSKLDGTYALQTAATDGAHEFVTVELLGVSNGKAGVRGDGLADGDTVWVPA